LYTDATFYDRNTIRVRDYFNKNFPDNGGSHAVNGINFQKFDENGNVNTSRPFNEEKTIDMGERPHNNDNLKLHDNNINGSNEDNSSSGSKVKAPFEELNNSNKLKSTSKLNERIMSGKSRNREEMKESEVRENSEKGDNEVKKDINDKADEADKHNESVNKSVNNKDKSVLKSEKDKSLNNSLNQSMKEVVVNKSKQPKKVEPIPAPEGVNNVSGVENSGIIVKKENEEVVFDDGTDRQVSNNRIGADINYQKRPSVTRLIDGEGDVNQSMDEEEISHKKAPSDKSVKSDATENNSEADTNKENQESQKENVVLNNYFVSTENVGINDKPKQRKHEDITYRDFDELRADEAIDYDTRSLCQHFIDELAICNIFVYMFSRVSIIQPSYIRIFKFFILLHMLYVFNAIVHTDDYIDLLWQYETVIS
jgi:hypothetical protein